MKLLVTGAWTNEESCLEKLRQMGHDVVFMQNESDELPLCASLVEGVICNGLFLHHSIKEFSSLKYIQLTSAGLDRVPMDYITEKGIKIYNARGVYSVPMAEFALCGVLQLLKQSAFFYNNKEQHKWEKRRDIAELFGKTVCIIGCGSVGVECAKRFSSFGCSVLGVDVAAYENALFERIYPLEDLDKVLSRSDIVVLTLPLTDKTKHLFGSERFKKMKRGAVLVNIARGAIVDTEALIAALGGSLGGAVLDVFEQEPLSDNSPLWDMDNVILTPHNSFVGENNRSRLCDCIIKNLNEGVLDEKN